MTTITAPKGETSTISIPVDKAGSYIAALPVASIKVGKRYRQDHGDLDALAASIKQVGLLQPIGVDKEHCLIFGERRLRAHQHLGLATIKARIIEVDTLLAEQAENEVRKDFTPSERVAIAKAIEEALGNRRGQRTDKVTGELPQNFGEVKGKETAQIAAKAAGFGNAETYRQAKTVVKDGIPELVEAMDKGEIAVSTAAKLAKAEPEVQKEAAAKPQDAPRLAKVAPSPSGIKEAAVPNGKRTLSDWEIKRAGSDARKVSAALNLLKGKEDHLDPKAKATLARNINAALVRLGKEDIEQGIKRHLDEILPTYAAEYDRYKAFSDAHAGVFTDEEYRLLVSVLHPDRCPPDRSAQFDKAFHLIKSKQDLLCKAKESDRPASLPSSLSELVSRRGRKAGTKEGAIND